MSVGYADNSLTGNGLQEQRLLAQNDASVYTWPDQTDNRATFREVLVQINNILDSHYYTASQLQATGFTSTGNYIAQPLPPIGGEFPVVQAAFYAAGAPTTYWVGTRIKF